MPDQFVSLIEVFWPTEFAPTVPAVTGLPSFTLVVRTLQAPELRDVEGSSLQRPNLRLLERIAGGLPLSREAHNVRRGDPAGDSTMVRERTVLAVTALASWTSVTPWNQWLRTACDNG